MRRKEGSYLTAGTIARVIFTAVMLTAYFLIKSAFQNNPAYADSYREVIKSISMILSGATSYVSFTVAELLVFLLIAGVLIYLVFTLYKLIIKKEALPRLLRMLTNFAALASAAALLFFALYGAAYYCSPVSEQMGIYTGAFHERDLAKLTTMMRDKANEYADLVPRDFEGNCYFGNFAGMATLIPKGYETLSSQYGFLSSVYAPVKSIFTWKVMAHLGVSGIYFPFTAEAIVSPDSPDQTILFTMAHETAHRLAVAPEDEANFIAFLSCRSNSDRRVIYSGYFMAYIYCINALYSVNADAALEISAGVEDNLANDIAEHNESIRQYAGWLSDFGNTMNDMYLKSNGQTAGTKSYGLMVDLLLAEYRGQL